jgi:hypothetical protein
MDAVARSAKTMSANLPIVRSAGARAFFLASVAVTLGIVFWIQYLRPDGLTAISFVLCARLDRLAMLFAPAGMRS